jgi:hypothetical protein
MAAARPRQPHDPSILASTETAVSTVARPGILAAAWHWRYELGLVTGLATVALASGYMLGAAWLIAMAATGVVLLAAATLWPPARRRLITRTWCVITPHRVRTGCAHAWVQSRDGRLPVILYTTPADFGERVMLWCRAGITAGDLEAAREILRTACWASDVRVVTSARYPHIVVLEVVRRGAAGRPDAAVAAWPHLDRGEADGADPQEPALPAGLGNHGPFRWMN